jgi:hypothetical protein
MTLELCRLSDGEICLVPNGLGMVDRFPESNNTGRQGPTDVLPFSPKHIL